MSREDFGVNVIDVLPEGKELKLAELAPGVIEEEVGKATEPELV